MTREQVLKQVMIRAGVKKDDAGIAHEELEKWLAMFPGKYVFGTHEVMSGERLVKRALGRQK